MKASVSFVNCLTTSDSNMKFSIVAALLAVVAADSAYPTHHQSSYSAASYQSNSYDYPAQPYHFAYSVKDAYYNDYGHQESSDGKAVSGSYHVVLPDGRVQIVTYTADDYSGYNAKVTYSGHPKAYEHKSSYKAGPLPAPTYKTASYSAPTYNTQY